MVLQKIIQFAPGQMVISLVSDEPRPGESQDVFEARMLAVLEKVYGLARPDPTNPSMYKEPEE